MLLGNIKTESPDDEKDLQTLKAEYIEITAPLNSPKQPPLLFQQLPLLGYSPKFPAFFINYLSSQLNVRQATEKFYSPDNQSLPIRSYQQQIKHEDSPEIISNFRLFQYESLETYPNKVYKQEKMIFMKKYAYKRIKDSNNLEFQIYAQALQKAHGAIKKKNKDEKLEKQEVKEIKTQSD